MAATIEIDSNAVDLVKGTLSIEGRIGERSTASFITVDTTGAAAYERGLPVEIYDNDLTKIFGGFISSANRRRVGATGDVITHNITCMDNHYLADKRLVVKSYTSKTLKHIVEDIHTDYLAAEGITIGEVQTGPTLSSAVFNYVKASDAYDALQELSGFIWFINEDKKLYFIDRATNSAPWNLDMTTYKPIKGSVFLDVGNPKYRNRQYVRGGTGTTSLQTETFTGDGVNVSFTIGYPLALEPTVTVNAVGQTVGIKGIDTGKDCYWSKGDATVTFAAAPGAVAVVIAYYGQYPLIARVDNFAGETARAAIEGGTGIVEDIVTESQHESSDTIEASANAKITLYCQDAERFIYRTTDSGLSPGQIQEITFSPFSFTAHEMLIESVAVTASVDTIYYDVSCITGPTMGSWSRFFSSILTRQDNQIKIGDGLLLVLLLEEDTLEMTEVTSIDEDEFAVSGQVNRWLNSAPISAGSLYNIQHERLEMTESTSETTHLTEDYDWDDADMLWDFFTYA